MNSQDKKIRLLYFASDFKIGLSHLLTEQAKYFPVSEKIDYYAIAGETEQEKGFSETWKSLTIPLVRIKGLDDHKMFFDLIKRLDERIEEFHINVVHVQNNWQLALVSYLKFIKRKKIRIIYTVHGYRHNFRIRSIMARYAIMLALLFTTDKVLVCSSYVRKKFFLVRQKSTLLFLGLGERYFLSTRPVVQNGTRNIVFAAQFRKGKNQEVIISALARYINTTKGQNCHLYLPGSGPLLESCRKLALDSGIGESVFFPGQLTISEVYNLYQSCNIAVIPSNAETFGHCIAEPFALGCCVFTRKTGIAEDIITNGISGIFFNTEDDLYNLFCEYLPSPEKMAFIGKNAFENRDSLRFSKIALQYNSILEGILQN